MADHEQHPVLTSIEAQLFVADITASCRFYNEKLGFSVAFVYGEPPYYAQVTRDSARLNLRTLGEPVFVGDVRAREGLLSCSITMAHSGEIDRLSEIYQSAGAIFHQPLRREPWGSRTFIIQDPDGNLLLFAGPPEPSA